MKAVRCFYCGKLVKAIDVPTDRQCMIPPHHAAQEGEDGFAVLTAGPTCEGFRFKGTIEEVEVDEKGNVIF